MSQSAMSTPDSACIDIPFRPWSRSRFVIRGGLWHRSDGGKPKRPFSSSAFRGSSFGPTDDRCYQPPAMENVANFYLHYARNASQVTSCDLS